MRQARTGLALAAAMAAAGAALAQPPDVAQAQADWEKALAEPAGPAAHYVMASVNGKTGCLTARQLVGAAAKEAGSSEADARAQLLKNVDHALRLTKADAIDAIKGMSAPEDIGPLVADSDLTSRIKIEEKKAGGWLPDQGPNLAAFACVLIRFGYAPWLDGPTSTVMF